MRVDLFDYDLPPERIALRPAEPRESAGLLVVDVDGALRDKHIADLPDLLRPGDMLVVNDTRVIAARLQGVRQRGGALARIEATLIKRLDASRWRALARPAKKLQVGERIHFGGLSESSACALSALDADVEGKGDNGEIILSFDFSGGALDDAIERFGQPPLPPYIAARRPIGDDDKRNYQTHFAIAPGAVAAPTAGLHFTPALIERLRMRGVTFAATTLHVGAGTFLPVKVEDTDDHVMHSEWAEIDAANATLINAARARGGRIVAVGTTSLRALESAAGADGLLHPFAGDTSLFITPGYRFKCADALITNFHLPRSSLLMLVSAFSGMATIKTAYAHGIAAGYRFYSYGDACLLARAQMQIRPQ